MIDKDYIKDLISVKKGAPANPFLKQPKKSKSKEKGDTSLVYIRFFFSIVSVALSMLLIYALKDLLIFPVLILIGIALLIIVVIAESHKVRAMDEWFFNLNLSEADIPDAEMYEEKVSSSIVIAVGTILLSLALAVSSIVKFTIDASNERTNDITLTAQQAQDSVRTLYTERVDSVMHLLTDTQIEKYVEQETERDRETVKDLKMQIEQATQIFNKTPYAKKDQVNYNATVASLREQIERYEEKIDAAKTDRIKELKGDIKQLNAEGTQAGDKAYRDVLTNYDRKNSTEGMGQLILVLLTVFIEGAIVILSKLNSNKMANRKISVIKYNEYIKSLDEYREMLHTLEAVHVLYKQVGENNSFTPKQRNKIISDIYDNEVTGSSFMSILNSCGVTSSTQSRKLAIPYIKAKERVMDRYASDIVHRLTA